MIGKTSGVIVAEVGDGDFLGDYQVLNVIGRGLTGTTYHVMGGAMKKEFALKSLFLSETLSLEWLDRLEAQTALQSKFTHPYIDRVVSSGRSGSLWFCLKDLSYDGNGNPCNLRTYMRQHGGKLSHYQVFHIVSQILEVLIYTENYEDIHHKGVCHGNLKPENILLAHGLEGGKQSFHTVPFEVRVSDFQPYGLIDESIILDTYLQWMKKLKDYPPHLRERGEIEALKSIYSSFDYRAPEMECSTLPTVEGDMYSLGVMTYEMLTGKVPCGRFPYPNEQYLELPSYWNDFLLNCLNCDFKKRYRGASQALEELKEAFSDDLLLMNKDISIVQKGSPVQEKEKKVEERRSLTPLGMVYIPSGNFFVGGEDCGSDALPQHECSTKGFYLDRTPVTNKQFRKFVEEAGYISEAEKGDGAPIWGEGHWKVLPGISWKNPLGELLPEDFDHHPVTQVTYADAVAYAEWMGRRLPTEEEWEYAARGGQRDIKYPWGNEITRSNANYLGEGTTPVMQYQANGYGLYEMAGNVWEWTSSWYQPYPGNMRENPHFGEKYKVVRGGAWMYDGAHCMVSYRNANQLKHCYPTLGFRTAYDFVVSKDQTEEKKD